MTNLTPKQQRIYDFIRTFTRRQGYPPTLREIGQAVGVRSPSTVKYHLDNLRQVGLIQWDGGKTRSLSLPHPARCPARPGPPGGPRGRRGPHPGGGTRGGLCPLPHRRPP